MTRSHIRAARILRTRLAPLLLAAGLALGAAACDDDGTGSDTREVAIGGIFSLTGNWATLGVTSEAAMELAVEDVNAFAAGRGIRFRADVRDTRLDPAEALAAVQSLRADGVQLIVGPQSSAELAVLKPYVDANPVLIVSQSSTAGSLAVAGDRIFRFTAADSLEGVAVTALMWDDGVRHLIPVWRGDAGNRGLHVATRARLTARGGTVATGHEYGATATTYAALVDSLAADVSAALATRPAGQVAVYLAGFDEVAEILALASTRADLDAVRWYGSDGVALSAALLARPAAVAFMQEVGFPAPIFGLDAAAQDRWQPLAARIRTRAGGVEPDAFALAVYDAVWVAAQAYLASPADVEIDDLQARFTTAAAAHYGATGWTVLNAAGDRRYANFDFFGVRPAAGGHAWTLLGGYDTRLDILTRR